MSEPETPSTRPGATSAQLKHDINSGRTGDKVAGFDPAAAPLGVDEEAGGAPHDPMLNAITREEQSAGRPYSPRPNASTPELQPNASGAPSRYALPSLIGLVAAAAIGRVLLWVR